MRTAWIRGEGRDITINPDTVYETVPVDATPQERRAIERRNRQLAETAPRETYPGTLVTFRDITDPTTIELVDLADLEATFGPGVRFVSGRYELTNAAPSDGRRILDILPWLRDGPVDVVGLDIRRNAAEFSRTQEGWKLYIDVRDFIQR